MAAHDIVLPRSGRADGWDAPAGPAPRRVDAAWWRGLGLWQRLHDDRRARACETLRRSAGPRLAAGAALDQVARDLGVAPGQLAAAHAMPFDPAESPLKARRLTGAAEALRQVLQWPGHLQARGDGWRAELRGGTAPGATTALATEPGLQLHALQLGTARPALHWFDRAGAELWQWHPAPGDGERFDMLVRTRGSTDLRAGPQPATMPRRAARGAAHRAGPDGTHPAGAGWDLLLHASVHGMPLGLSLGTGARLDGRAPLRQVGLDGQALRLQAGEFTLWLAETAVWLDTDAAVGLLVGHGLQLRLADTATRAQAATWQRLVAAVSQDRPVHACGC